MEIKMYTFSHHDHIELIKQFWNSKKYSLKVEFTKYTNYTIWTLEVKRK